MTITTSLGDFSIIQTACDKDELLILGSWIDLVSSFDSSRTFIVNKEEQVFGVYICKQECVEFLSKAVQQIDSNWNNLKVEKNIKSFKLLA